MLTFFFHFFPDVCVFVHYFFFLFIINIKIIKILEKCLKFHMA